jgi:hypothetical protein
VFFSYRLEFVDKVALLILGMQQLTTSPWTAQAQSFQKGSETTQPKLKVFNVLFFFHN